MRLALPPGATIGHYRILRTLGEGGMGCVYLAEDLVLGRHAAVKVIRGEDDSAAMRQRLLREARAASALTHPNICTIYEAGVFEDEPYIAMQYVEGTPLLDIRSRVTIDDVLRIAAGVAQGLAEAHRLGLVHRDIKPQNVMLNDREVVILDFGLARTADPKRDEQITARDAVAGTAPYMSPEQLRGEVLDGRSDVFSLGVMLYELLNGRRPFDRNSAVETISAILHDDPPPSAPRGARAAALDALVLRMLHKRARERPAAAEVADGIQGIQRMTASAEAAPTTVISRVERTGVASRPIPNVDAEAAKLYLRAREIWKKRNPPAMRNAIALLQQAIEIEPEYARAYSALADCYVFLGFLQTSAPDTVFPKAEAAIARAIDLDPNLAEAHASRGFVQTVFGWNRAAAEAAFDEAIALDANLAVAHHWRGLLLRILGRHGDAETALRRAAELDPLSPIFATAVGFVRLDAGDPDGAIRIYRSVIESEPAFVPVHFYLGLALESAGRIEDAIASLRTAADAHGTETEAVPALAHALATSGRHDEARAIVERLHAASREKFISPVYFAVAAIGLGEREEALTWLERAAGVRAVRMSELHLDRRFAPLWGEARFERVMERVGMRPEP